MTQAASSATLDRAGTTIDIPDLWTRQDQPGGAVLSYPYRREDGAPGTAKILVAAPRPGPLAAAWPGFVDGNKLVAAERPLLHGEGQGWNGGAVRWEMRCCSLGGTKAETIHAGVEQGGVTNLFFLLLVDADHDTQISMERAFEAIVRSVRPVGRRPGMPDPPADAGGLDGLYTTLRVGTLVNAFGGMDMHVDLETMTFDPAGRFVRDVLPDGSVASRCARVAEDCGIYVVHGDMIELDGEVDAYGRVSREALPFARVADGGLKIGGTVLAKKTPFAPGARLNGLWRYTWASSGSMAFSSGGASVERTLRLAPDGTFHRTGYTGFSGSYEGSGGGTSVVGSSPKPDDGGRYTLDGYRLTLTPATGPAQVSTIFEADPNDGMLVIGGSNYLKRN